MGPKRVIPECPVWLTIVVLLAIMAIFWFDLAGMPAARPTAPVPPPWTDQVLHQLHQLNSSLIQVHLQLARVIQLAEEAARAQELRSAAPPAPPQE